MASKVKPTDVTGRAREVQLEENAQVLQEKAALMQQSQIVKQ